MDFSMNQDIAKKISETIFIANANLPLQVFKKKFDYYIFFDESLRGTPGVPTDIKNLIERSSSVSLDALMLSSIDHEFLVHLDSSCDWEKIFKEIHSQRFDRSEMDSFAIVSTNEDWAVFQKWPVDIGVIGLTRKNDVSHFFRGEHTDFFSAEDVCDWIDPKINQETNYVQRYGHYFLAQLWSNYQ
jgi:hypothetical protein